MSIYSQKYYIIYKTTNLINGMEYIGAHSTYNIDDSYLGSGVSINAAIKKYGRNNFKKEILHIFYDETSMYEKERELVNEEYTKSRNTYNQTIGGRGAPSGTFNGMYGRSHTDDVKLAQSKRNKEREKLLCPICNELIYSISKRWHFDNCKLIRPEPPVLEKKPRKCTEETRRKISEANTGNKWSDESKERFSKIRKEIGNKYHTEEWRNQHSEDMTGVNNPMYGKSRTPEEREKMSKNRKRGVCEHCGKESTMSIITLHHGNNCKLKPSELNTPVITMME